MRGRSTAIGVTAILTIAGLVAALIHAAASPAMAEAAAAATLRTDRQMNLHRHGIGIRVGRVPLPNGGVQVRVVTLPPTTPDLVQPLKPTSAQMQDAAGRVVALQRQADGSLLGTVPPHWLQAGMAHQLRLQAWSGSREVANVRLDYLLP